MTGAGRWLAVACAAVATAGVGMILRYGLRLMLHKIFGLKGEAVLHLEDSDVQDRHAWDSYVRDAVLLTHERRDCEETNDDAADILLWEAELDSAEIQKHQRRMDRWFP